MNAEAINTTPDPATGKEIGPLDTSVYTRAVVPRMSSGIDNRLNQSSGRAVNDVTVLITMRSSKTLYTRESPYFDSPNWRAWWRTLISAILGPAIDAIAGMNRCISEYSGISLISAARYAFSEQPLSMMGTPVTLLIRRLAIREGILRDMSLSLRSCRQPT